MIGSSSAGFFCPQCGAPGGLKIVSSLELGSDSRSDELTVQAICCEACSFRGVAVYEESRRGALDDESWDHYGYRLDEGDFAVLGELIGNCANPDDSHCICPSHQAIGFLDEWGRWNGLERFHLAGYFNMRLVET